MQIFADEKEPDEIELWREDLIWVQSADHPLKFDGNIPFVAFDTHCFYRRAAQAALAESGRSLNVVLECPSAHGVQSGVRHGLGVAIIGRRRLIPGLSQFAGDLPQFPPVCHVLRSGKRLSKDLDASLTDAIVQEMLDK